MTTTQTHNECQVFLLVGACGNHVASHDRDLLTEIWEEQIGNSLAGSRIVELTVSVPVETPVAIPLTIAPRPTISAA